jgi:hypothetical protein
MVADDAAALVTVIAVTDADGAVGDVGDVGDVAAPLPPHATSAVTARLVIANRHTRFIHASPCVHCHDPRGK